MRVFVSYATEDRDLAEQTCLALTGAGFHVFFDKESLPIGSDYHERIRAEVQESDIFVFLISPNSLSSGTYALTELKYARDKWSHPKGHVVPVVLESVAWETIPAYLKAITILEPEGNVSAEVADEVSKLQRKLNMDRPSRIAEKEREAKSTARKWINRHGGAVIGAGGTVIAAIVGGVFLLVSKDQTSNSAKPPSTSHSAVQVEQLPKQPPADEKTGLKEQLTKKAFRKDDQKAEEKSAAPPPQVHINSAPHGMPLEEVQ